MRTGLYFLACTLATAIACDRQPSAPEPSQPEQTKTHASSAEAAGELDLDDEIDRAASYLERAVDENGRFDYRINLGDETPPEQDYNVLRHAGALYALGDYYAYSPDEETRAAIRRGARYMTQRYVRAPAEHDDMLAVFSRPDEENLGTGEPEAKLGGAALAVLALDAARETQALDDVVDTMRGLGRFILFMQRPDGSFHSKYSEEEGFLEFESAYYPGEAVLALVTLYEVDRDVRWLRAAARGTASVVSSRRDAAELPNDHWLMIASEPLLEHYDDLESPPMEADVIRRHVLDLGLAMVREQENAIRASGPTGAFTPDGRSTPTATRLEGLLALWRTNGSDSRRKRSLIWWSIETGIEFLVRCQVEEGTGRGGFLRALKPFPDSPAFNKRQTEIRIDYVQHALSAMLGWQRVNPPGGDR